MASHTDEIMAWEAACTRLLPKRSAHSAGEGKPAAECTQASWGGRAQGCGGPAPHPKHLQKGRKIDPRQEKPVMTQLDF